MSEGTSTSVLAEPRRSVSLAAYFGLLTLCGLLAGLWVLLGPQGVFPWFVMAYAFAPTIALGVIWLLREYALSLQVAAAGATLLFFAVGMAGLCCLEFGYWCLPIVLGATGIEWFGQAMILACLRWIAMPHEPQLTSRQLDVELKRGYGPN